MWTQLLTALLVGLLTAFALQLLITNLGIAIGITALGFHLTKPEGISETSPEAIPETAPEIDSEIIEADEIEDSGQAEYFSQKEYSSQNNLGKALDKASSAHSSPKTGILAGLSLLLTVNIVLSVACFLAAKFSQVNSSTSGAIVGVVIWSAYFLILTWVSSTAVSSIIGSILSSATGGFRQLITTIATVVKGQDKPPLSEEKAIAIVRQEVQQALRAIDLAQALNDYRQLNSVALSSSHLTPALNAANPDTPVPDAPINQPYTASNAPEDSLQDFASAEQIVMVLWQEMDVYLHSAHTKKLTPKRVKNKLKGLLDEAQAQLANGDTLPEFDQAPLKKLLKSIKGLDKKQKQRILVQSEQTWNLTVEQAQTSHSPAENSDSSPIATYASQVLQQLNLPDGQVIETVQQHLPEWLTISSGVAAAIRQQFNKIDWETLSDRLPLQDLTDDQVQKISTEVRSIAQQVLNTPQQWTGNYVIPQVEELREQMMERIDQFQTTIQQRVETLKRQTQQRIEDSRKAAVVAAWWLFATASTAALSAAIAGALAARNTAS